jgi:hypothetical protein
MSRPSPHEVSHSPDDHFYPVKVITAHRCCQRPSLRSINDQGLHRPEQGLNRLRRSSRLDRLSPRRHI